MSSSGIRWKPIFHDIKKELHSRLPLYKDDWLSPFKSTSDFSKVLASIVFMIFTSTVPAIAFAAYLNDKTGGQYGVIEVLLVTGMSGLLYSIFSGQPLVILGVTGPISVFAGTMFGLCQGFGVDFLATMFWTGFWAGLMHIALGVCNGFQLISLVTRYSCEVFDLLIALIYIYTGISYLVHDFQAINTDGNNEKYFATSSSALLSLTLAVGTFYLALSLSRFRHSPFYTRTVRYLISDYAVAVSVILFTIMHSIPFLQNIPLKILSGSPSNSLTPSNGRRSWFIDPLAVPIGTIFAAILPGFILTVLFFFDHAISSLLAQSPRYKLKKPAAYNYDFAVLGVLLILTSSLGLPFYNGLIPQAPLHTRSLCDIEEEVTADDRTGRLIRRERFSNCREQRLSNFTQSLLAALCACLPTVLAMIKNIPLSVLSGLFLYMASGSFEGNTLVERCKVLFFVTSTKYRQVAAPHAWQPINDSNVAYRKVVLFTVTQIVFTAVIFCVMETQLIALLFPLFIIVMVPFRAYLMPNERIMKQWQFTSTELQALDDLVYDDDSISNTGADYPASMPDVVKQNLEENIPMNIVITETPVE